MESISVAISSIDYLSSLITMGCKCSLAKDWWKGSNFAQPKKFKASSEDIVRVCGIVESIMYAQLLLLKYNMFGENTIGMLHIQE